MTNLEKILQMKKKVDEMSLEVMTGINIQTEAIKKSRQERAIEMYEYFEGLRSAIDAKSLFGFDKERFVLRYPVESSDGHTAVLRIHEVGTEFMFTRYHDFVTWRLNKDGKIDRGFEPVVDAWEDGFKEVVENELAEFLRKQTLKQIEELKERQAKANKISAQYGLEER